jgi:hypothetical protein
MIPIAISRLSSGCRRLAPRDARSLLLLPLTGCLLACVSCTDQGPPIVDTTPLGDGLKVIGYAVVAAAVLAVLGKLVK